MTGQNIVSHAHQHAQPGALIRLFVFSFLMLFACTLGTQTGLDAQNSPNSTQHIPELIQSTAINPSCTSPALSPAQHQAFRYLFETMLGSVLLLVTSDYSTACTIALAASIQLFYLTLWRQEWYIKGRTWVIDAINEKLDQYQLAQYSFVRTLVESPWFQKIADKSWIIYNNGTIFMLTSYILTTLFPALHISAISPTWPAFFKRFVGPGWLSNRYIPLVEGWAANVAQTAHTLVPHVIKTQALQVGNCCKNMLTGAYGSLRSRLQFSW